jgi:hypothetical protein
MENAQALFAVLLGIAAVAGMLWWHFSRSEAILQRWADQNGFHIIDRRPRLWFKGPFFWTTSRSQVVYSVTVEDNQGRRRTGWVRCGGWFFGLLSDHVDVRWDN